MVYRYLRRYTTASKDWTCEAGWHQAKAFLDEVPAILNERGRVSAVSSSEEFAGDERWPAECEKGCGYRFTTDPGLGRAGDAWQVFTERVYADASGQKWSIRDLPPGAMYDADWAPWKGPDGRSLTVILPGGHSWSVDSEASNCTRKGEAHACWVRHGDPTSQPVTVDKAGDTCAAGGGSIAVEGWHGFLRQGELVE
jgi:hypothetical protein